MGVWEAVWSQAATEAAEGEGWWSGGGGAERAVAMRRRGVSAVMPVSAGSHSSKCASVRSVAVVCSDVAMSSKSVDDGQCFVVVEGCATPIKIGGVLSWGAEERGGLG